MAYKSIFGGNTPTPSGLNPTGTGYKSVFSEAKADVSTPLNAGIETSYYKSVFDKPKTTSSTEITNRFLDSFVYSKGLKLDSQQLPQQIPSTSQQRSSAPKTEAELLLSSPGLKQNVFTPELAKQAKALNSLATPSEEPNLWKQISDGLKGVIPGTAVTLPQMAGQAMNFAGGLLDTTGRKLDQLSNSKFKPIELYFNTTPLGFAANVMTGRFNDSFAVINGLDPKDPDVQEALKIMKPATYYQAAGTKLKTDADARMKAHPEWARPDYFHADDSLDGVIANLRDYPVAYVTRVASENTPQLAAQIALSLTTGGVGSMTFMGMSAGGDTYENALKHGVSQDEAVFLASARGLVEASLEQLGLDKVLKSGASKQISSSFVKNLWLKIQEVGVDVLIEGSTEALQQLISNAIAMTFDENQGLFDGVASSFFAGGITAGPVSFGTKFLGMGADADGNALNQNILPNTGASTQEQQQQGTGTQTAPGSSQSVQPGLQTDTTLNPLEAPATNNVSPATQDIIQGIAEAEINPPAQGFNATQSQPDSRVTDLPRVQIEGANQNGQQFILDAADLRRIQGEKFITSDGQNFIEAPVNESSIRVLDARTITDRDSRFLLSYQNTDLSAKEIFEQVSPQGFDVVIDSLGRVAANQETLANLQQLARFQELRTKSELPGDLRDVIDRYASVRDLTLAGDMVSRRLESQGIDIPKTVGPTAIDLSNVNPEEVIARMSELQRGAQVAPMSVKLTAEGITLPKAEDNVTAAALRQMGRDVPVKINPTDLLNQVVKQFGYDNLKDYFDVREDVKAFRRGETNLPSFSKETGKEGTRLSPTQAERIVRKYFGDNEVTVQVAKQILTPKGERAVGSYRGSIITFAENPFESTPTHEVLHAYFDMFTSTSRKEQVLREVMREYDVSDRIEAEEILADEFVNFVRGQESTKWTDIIRNFFERVWENIKTLANHRSEVYALYNDIIAKRRPEGVQVSNDILSNAQMFQTEGDVTLKVFSLPEFMKPKDMLVSEFLNVIKSSRAALKTNEQAFIEGVIKGYFPGKERISLLKLKNALLTESLQLREITTGSYKDYGLNRVGLKGIDNKQTVILNSPYDHGNVGHWDSEYNNEQKKLYKTIPLGEQVGVVETWVDPSIENQDIKTYFVGTEEQAKSWLEDHKDDREPINKGLFAHYRVWRTEGYQKPYVDRFREVFSTAFNQASYLGLSYWSPYGLQTRFFPERYPDGRILNKDLDTATSDEAMHELVPQFLKVLADKTGREVTYEKLKQANELVSTEENLIKVAEQMLLIDQNDIALKQQIFDLGLENPDLDNNLVDNLFLAKSLTSDESLLPGLTFIIRHNTELSRGAVQDITSNKDNQTIIKLHLDGFKESSRTLLEKQNPIAIREGELKKLHDTLKETDEKYWNERNDTSPYQSFIAEIQGDSFQQEKYKNSMDRDSITAEVERNIRSLESVVKSNENFLAAAKDLAKVQLPDRQVAAQNGVVSFSKEAMAKMKLTPLAKQKIENVFVDHEKFVGVSSEDITKLFTIKGVFPDWWKKAHNVLAKHGLNLTEYSSNDRTVSLRESLLYRFNVKEAKATLQENKEKLAEAKEHLKSLDGKVVPMTATIEKNFAAFQNTWHELTTKRIIQDEARKGAEAIYFPSLSTIAKIEGFTSGDVRKQIDKPSGHSEVDFDISGAVLGEEVEYGGRSWTVLEEGYSEIIMGLSTGVEIYDQRDVEQMFDNDVDGMVEDQLYDLKRLEKAFGDTLYEPDIAAEIIASYDDLTKYTDNVRIQKNIADARQELSRLKNVAEAINDPAINPDNYSVTEIADQQIMAQQAIDKNIELLAKEGLTETSVIEVPKAFKTVTIKDIPSYIDYSIERILTGIADGDITSSSDAERKLYDEAAESLSDYWSFTEQAQNMGWTVYTQDSGRETTYYVVKDESSAETRSFSEEDFTTDIAAPSDEMRTEMEKDAEELTEEDFFKKYYKELFKKPANLKEDDADPNKAKRGVIYFYEAKVISYLNKLRKGNLELVEVDGDWWYKTNVTPDDTGPVTMFQVEKPTDLSLGKPVDQLMTEARQYKTPEEFIKAQQPEKVTFTTATEKASYMGGHEAPMAEGINNPIWDLTGEHTGNDLYPKDIYSFEASRLYSSGTEADPQAIGILQSLKGKPNESVAVYRAVPKDAPSELNPGDWITLTRAYAKEHGESNLKGDFKIVKRTVKARDIFTDANSIQEFGYDPQPRLAPKNTPYNMLSKSLTGASYQKQLTRIWNEANGLTPVTMFQVDKTADQIVAENIVKGVPTVKQAINNAIKGEKSPTKIKTEEQLLKDSLRAQRRVARSIVKNTQQRLAAEFANKLADIRKVKTYLTEYLKMLPLNERGKMITMVRDAETIFDLAKAATRINLKVEEVQKKDVIAEIRKVYTKTLESPGVDVGFKAQISGLFNEIQLQGKSKATMERFQKLREFIQKRQANGEPVYIQSRLLRQLEMLDKTPIKEVPVEQLEAMLADMELLESQGRVKVELRERAYRRNVQNIADEVMPELIPIDKPEYIKALPGEKLTKEEKLKNIATKNKRVKLTLGKPLRPMDVFFDMFSGGKGLYTTQFFKQFKGRIDHSYQSYLQEKDRLIEPINELAETLKLTPEEMDNIGIYAQLKQEGGLDKLIQLGYDKTKLGGIELSEREMQFYNALRAGFADMYPTLKEYMHRVYNKDIGSVENYFPMVTDWDQMNEVDMIERFGATSAEEGVTGTGSRPKKNNIAGSTYERKRNAKQKIVVNALVAYKRHMDNAIYMVEMGETIRTLGDVIKVPGFKESIGNYGYQILLEYIDLLARKGGKDNDPLIPWLDNARHRLSVGVMGFKMASMLVQPSAFGNGAADIGTEHAVKGLRHLADPAWKEFALDNMPELKARVGNDPAMAELDELTKYKKFTEMSMGGLKYLDSKTAAAIAMGAYEKYMDEHGLEVDFENPNKDALAYAQLKLRRTQGSNFFKDQPLMFSRGALSGNRSFDRTIGAFQSFMINNWSWLQYDFPERMRNNPKQAVESALWLVAASAYTVLAQGLTKDLLSALFGGDGEDDPFMERLVKSFFGNIPIVSQLMSIIEYGSSPVPIISTTDRIIRSTQTVFSPSAKPATRAKATVRAASGVGTVFGIPGSSQLGDIVTRLMTGRD